MGDFDALRTDDLGQQARAGDEDSFRRLFERLGPTLYAWTRLRLRGRAGSESDVQDVLQEVWLRALQGFASYDPARSFRAWILGIAKHVVLQRHEKGAREVRLPSAAGTVESRAGLQLADSVTSVSLRLARDDAVQRFLVHVDHLEEEERLLVLYCGLEELPLSEAAARLGIKLEAATKRWQTLRARLRQNGMLQALVLAEE